MRCQLIFLVGASRSFWSLVEEIHIAEVESAHHQQGMLAWSKHRLSANAAGNRRSSLFLSEPTAYASSWLKCWHSDVFCAALLNSQPKGFYAPAQIVGDGKTRRSIASLAILY